MGIGIPARMGQLVALVVGLILFAVAVLPFVTHPPVKRVCLLADPVEGQVNARISLPEGSFGLDFLLGLPPGSKSVEARQPLLELSIAESGPPSRVYWYSIGSGGLVECSWLQQHSQQGFILTYNAGFKKHIMAGRGYEVSFRFLGRLPPRSSLWVCWSEAAD